MEDKIKIYCKNNNLYKEFNAGISLLDIYKEMEIQLATPLTAAKVNNKTESLTYICYNSKDVEFIGIGDPSGMRTYVRSLCFVFSKAVHDLYPDGKLYIEHPLSKGYYCDLQIGIPVTEEIIELIENRMKEIVAADYPMLKVQAQTEEAIAVYREHQLEDKALLLETTGDNYACYNTLDGYVDYFYGPLLPSTKWVYLFKLQKYNGGLLLRIPNPNKPDELQPYAKQDKMMAVFQELLQYQKVMRMSNVGDLNRTIQKGDISLVVKVAEAWQERQIGKIAEDIANRFRDGVRVVLISGPSSSGKTTFCKRLQIQLLMNTLNPISISLDDYYVNRVDTPLDENGEYDYESLYAIDLPKFNEDLEVLLSGGRVELPTYDFNLGERVYKGNSIKLTPNSVLVMEGIHAMNPLLLPQIDQKAMYKVYVSALTSISLDDHNWISTTDNRLIRRIVRDYQFRGYSAIETISRWPLVRKGEDKWIFPFQENADAMFNSAMLYELAALRNTAEPILKEVARSLPEYSEAHRLLKFLHYFNYVDIDQLPNTSLLREFVGGSSFEY